MEIVPMDIVLNGCRCTLDPFNTRGLVTMRWQLVNGYARAAHALKMR